MAARGVILDVDGTLLDSNAAHAQSWADVLAEHGHPVEVERVRALIGKGGDKLLAELAGIDDESEQGKAIAAARKARFKAAWLPKLRPFPGVPAFLERLRAAGIKVVVGTSAGGDELVALLTAAGVPELAAEAATSSDAEASKPDPDIIHAALDKLGLPPEDVVMVGDTPYDVEAASRAGVATIALRTGGWSDADLGAAAAIYDDVADLADRLESSPLGR